MNRWLILGGALAVSLLVTVVLWIVGVPGYFLFLAVPFFLLPLGGRSARRCPVCGFRTRAVDARFCPRDGQELH